MYCNDCYAYISSLIAAVCVFKASGERNYHIFYEMLIGLSAEERQLWRLQSWDKYKYLEQGGSEKVCVVPCPSQFYC